MDKVKSKIVRVKSEYNATIKLLRTLTLNKEYYLAVGEHTAIVRRTVQKGAEFLELQDKNESINTWHKLNERVLKGRFKCNVYQRSAYGIK